MSHKHHEAIPPQVPAYLLQTSREYWGGWPGATSGQIELPLEPVLPTDIETREQIPLCTGCVDYFPLALAAVANCSLQANEQHNPGEPMHWSRDKSTAHADKIMKHLTDRGTFDVDGIRHSTKLAWRALALLQTELEADGGLPGRASTFNSKET